MDENDDMAQKLMAQALRSQGDGMDTAGTNVGSQLGSMLKNMSPTGRLSKLMPMLQGAGGAGAGAADAGAAGGAGGMSGLSALAFL